MPFQPADGEEARWRQVDKYIDTKKQPGDLLSFQEVQKLLGVDKATAVGVVQQVRAKRERAGKRTLVSMRGAGWLLARPDQELVEDTRRHERVIQAAENRVLLLGSIQMRRDELTPDEQRTLDFKLAQAAGQAAILGSRRISAADILSMGGNSGSSLPITAPGKS